MKVVVYQTESDSEVDKLLASLKLSETSDIEENIEGREDVKHHELELDRMQYLIRYPGNKNTTAVCLDIQSPDIEVIDDGNSPSHTIEISEDDGHRKFSIDVGNMPSKDIVDVIDKFRSDLEKPLWKPLQISENDVAEFHP